MGMSIDEIEQWEKKNKTVKVPEEKWLLAQEIMRKYQKIEQIVKVWHQDIYAKDFECMAEIAEVVEDGNDD